MLHWSCHLIAHHIHIKALSQPVYIDSNPPPLVFNPTQRWPSTDSLFWGPGGCRMFAEERREEHAILKEFLDVKPPPDTTF